MVLENIHKYALITKIGLFDWTVMPFGMKNATYIFSRTINEVFGNYLNKFFKNFVDDINVHSTTWEKHLEHLHYILLRLREVNLKLNMNKCEFVNSNIITKGVLVR
jgi:hypothetical protein